MERNETSWQPNEKAIQMATALAFTAKWNAFRLLNVQAKDSGDHIQRLPGLFSLGILHRFA